jgi:hypothetical protein
MRGTSGTIRGDGWPAVPSAWKRSYMIHRPSMTPFIWRLMARLYMPFKPVMHKYQNYG